MECSQDAGSARAEISDCTSRDIRVRSRDALRGKGREGKVLVLVHIVTSSQSIIMRSLLSWQIQYNE
jgi:hypothetical protein